MGNAKPNADLTDISASMLRSNPLIQQSMRGDILVRELVHMMMEMVAEMDRIRERYPHDPDRGGYYTAIAMAAIAGFAVAVNVNPESKSESMQEFLAQHMALVREAMGNE